MQTRQVTSFFFPHFELQLFVTFTFAFFDSQNSFHLVPPPSVVYLALQNTRILNKRY